MTTKEITYSFLDKFKVHVRINKAASIDKDTMSFKIDETFVFLYEKYNTSYVVRGDYPLLVILLPEETDTVSSYFKFFGANELTCNMLLDYCFEKTNSNQSLFSKPNIVVLASGTSGFPAGLYPKGFHDIS